jgi:hypothetical protein
MEAMVRELLEAIEPHAAAISRATTAFGLQKEIAFGVYIRAETPALRFSRETLSRLATLGVTLDIDLILMRDT